MDIESLVLLQRTTDILLEAAKYYVVSHGKTAIKARKAVSEYYVGNDPFHAVIYGRLASLQGLIQDLDRVATLEQAESAVRQMLDTFDALVGYPKEPYGHHYPGLEQLQSMYRADGTSKRRPKPLGYRKYLFSPPLHTRTRLKNGITACCDALNGSNSDQDSAAILSDLESIREWRVPSSMLRHATRIKKVLLQYWTCQCSISHENVKLAFMASPQALAGQGVVGCYKLYWPLKEGSTSSYFYPTLHLLEQPQGSSPAPQTVFHKKAGKKAVRFASDDAGQSPATSPQTSSSICEALSSSNGCCALQVDEDALRTIVISNIHPPVTSARLQMQSLRVSLAPGAAWSFHDSRPKDRIVVAVALAYTYLHLSDTAWWPNREVHPDFWFAKDLSSSTVQATLPFLHFQVGEASSGKISTEGYINPHRPSLPALGKLLLEIWKGSKISWGEELDSAIAQCELDPLGEYWLCAVNACLGAENALKEQGPLFLSTRMRSVFVLKVIKSLQWLFEKCVRLPMDAMFAAPEESKVTHPPHVAEALSQKPTSLPYTATLNPPNDANMWCLHDGSRSWELPVERGNDAAESWFTRLIKEVHPLLCLHTDLVRVAIIDTGALFDKKSLAMYGSRVREIRSWVGLRGNEDGLWRPGGEDMDGHGTHATSVLLEVDPFSEVFVAKVFESRHEKQGVSMQAEIQHRVANAIKYAIRVWKVQVISVSFGFEQQVGVIRDAIVAAENSNVIVLAAASNNGGNARLTWPARHPTVFSVYATDGYGNKYHRNPTQNSHDDNFATLGSDVKAWWPSGKKVLRSGTSTATPVAAGIASMTMHFMRQHRAEYLHCREVANEDFDELLQRLSTYSGMRNVFRLMVERDVADRDGYNYVAPWWLFDRSLSRMTIVDKILAELKQA